jgi:hypothetical protein
LGFGCAPPYQVVRQAVPNVLAGAHSFSVEPVHFEGLIVGNLLEAEWLARKTPEQQASYMGDRQAMVQNFVERLARRQEGMEIIAGPPPTPQTFVIRPILAYIEPGFYAYVARRDTEARMRVQIFTGQGQLLDEIVVYSRITANLYNPSTGGRLRSAANHLADAAAAYLRDRTGVH